jgi:hypothetical protein
VRRNTERIIFDVTSVYDAMLILCAWTQTEESEAPTTRLNVTLLYGCVVYKSQNSKAYFFFTDATAHCGFVFCSPLARL